MDVELNCDICGQTCSVDGVEALVQVHGLIQTWAGSHTHPNEDLKFYISSSTYNLAQESEDDGTQ